MADIDKAAAEYKRRSKVADEAEAAAVKAFEAALLARGHMMLALAEVLQLRGGLQEARKERDEASWSFRQRDAARQIIWNSLRPSVVKRWFRG